MRVFIYKRNKDNLFTESIPLDGEFFRCPDPVPYGEQFDGSFQPVKEGDSWGQAWDGAWFHLTGMIPHEWAGKPVALWLDLNGEILIFDDNGIPVYSLTDGSVFHAGFHKNIFLLTAAAQGGEKLNFRLEAVVNSILGVMRTWDTPLNSPHPYGNYAGIANRMRIGVFNLDLWHLLLDFEVMLGIIAALPEGNCRAVRIVAALNDAVNAYAENPANARTVRSVLAPILALPAAASAMTVTAVGHAHIDTAWLWRIREGIRKCGRTFASQIHNIEKYPGYVFGASSPQHYAFVKEYYPELYKKIKQRVKDGSWELQGGMWVEADCNLIDGESMIRQFVHGKNFFMDEFGVDVKNLWLPDVFGYSAALPQICRKSGCDFFLSTKISCNQFNRFPYVTFNWQGLDGSQVISHFPPENTYNANLNPAELIPAQDRLVETPYLNEFISLFGIGDGGGGLREDHIERGLRMADLEGCPRVKFEPAAVGLERLRQYESQLPKWVGELYFELHRGTFTTQAKTKRGNRKAEQALIALEFLCSNLPPEKYPSVKLDALWKKLLLNQFHDIIPGSSIGTVYQDTARDHAAILDNCLELAQHAAAVLFTRDDQSAVLVNTLSYPYAMPLELPGSWRDCGVADSDGKPLPAQSENGRIVVMVEVAPSSFTIISKSAVTPINADSTLTGLALENDLIKYEFSGDGKIIRAWDKEAECELLSPGEAGNVFSLYGDIPNNNDAWDIDFFYENELLENARPINAVKTVAGPVRQIIDFELSIGASSIKQQAILSANSKRLDFRTEVKWSEVHKMLRIAFPTNIFANEAAFDIQYGFVKRPNHRNTSWNLAKFEVAAHRYADLSSPDYGVALLNDCKYGYKVLGNTIDLCLLRSPKFPDWDADQGDHVFTYSLLPHLNRLEESAVIAEAATLNRAPMLFDGCCSSFQPPFQIDADGISLEVVKKAEKEDALVIRLVETRGSHSSGTLSVKHPYYKLIETNLLEWTEEAIVDVIDGKVSLSLKPFEIRTYKLSRNAR